MSHARESLDDLTRVRMHRARFLQLTGAFAGAVAFSQARPDLGRSAPRPREYPFTLGVASGDPLPDGVVLWTRLAPHLYEPDGGMPSRRVQVRWRLATDDRMRRVVRRGHALAMPELAHSVHVELDGLDPDREFFYQFAYGGELSAIGRTRTAPKPRAHVRSLAFAFASCQAWDHGYYTAYARMAEEDLAFVVHLGDYVYEYGVDENGGVRNVPVPDQFRPECVTLERYRLQHALYKSDADLQRVHQLHPWMIVPDDR